MEESINGNMNIKAAVSNAANENNENAAASGAAAVTETTSVTEITSVDKTSAANRAVAEYGILQLAYIGDAVLELYVRKELLSRGNYPTGKLSKMAKSFVSCEAQSDAVARIEESFTEEEASVFRRGRNAKTKHTPSHGEIIQYKRATGLEAVFGFLYLSGKDTRAKELFQKAFLAAENPRLP